MIQTPLPRALRISLSVLLTAGLALLGPAALAQVLDCEVNGRSVNPANGNTTAGVTGLMRCVDRESREMRREQELQNGRFMGLERFYEKGKRVREHQTNERGNKEGVARTWSVGGALLSEETYLKGSNLGLQKHFHESGALRRLSFYELSASSPQDLPFIHTEEVANVELGEDGKLSGLRCARKPVIRFERIDDTSLCGFGAESRVALFSRGVQSEARVLREGRVIERTVYAASGQVRSAWVLKEGRVTERQFGSTGKPTREIISLYAERGSQREVEREFHESGQLVLEKRWNQGQLAAEWRWYLNGQPRQQIDHAGGESVRRDYHDNGQLASEGRYLRERYSQRPIGEHKTYDDRARLRMQLSYDDKGRIQRERAWDEAGTLTRDDQVFEDGSRKAFAR